MRRALVPALAVAALLLSATPAAAGHAWSNYHWRRTSNPFTVKLGNNLSGKWPGHLTKISADWTKSAVLNTSIVAGGTTPSQCNPTKGRVEVCNAKYGQNGWLGLATIWLSGSHIVKGTVKVNDTYYNTAKYDDPYARRHVLCQEVGHVFGLGHQVKAGSKTCMDDKNGLFSQDYIHPNQHDYDQLKAIYKHLDSSNRPVGSDTVMVTRTSHHDAILTFVFWAQPSKVDALGARR